MAYQHILTAIDLYENYGPLLKDAASFSQTSQAKMDLVHVLPTVVGTVPYAGDFQQEMEKESKTRMEAAYNQVKDTVDQVHELHGHPAQEIHRFAKEHNHDLIIAGSHGRHGLDLLLGSTACGLLHGNKTDVLTMRVDEEGKRLSVVPYKRVLLACDLHADSQPVIDQAKAMAKQFNAQLDLVCVAPDAAALGVMTLPNMEHDILARVREKAETLAREIGIDATHVHVKQGVIRLGVLEVAKSINADLIVVGSHGRHTLGAVVLGSTANALLHHAKSDVLVVKI